MSGVILCSYQLNFALLKGDIDVTRVSFILESNLVSRQTFPQLSINVGNNIINSLNGPRGAEKSHLTAIPPRFEPRHVSQFCWSKNTGINVKHD